MHRLLRALAVVAVAASLLPTGVPATAAAACTGANPIGDGRLLRLSGADRAATAIAISQNMYVPGSANAAVLARQDDFADGLVGGPLARRHNGPLLLTPRSSLRQDVLDELERVLPAGSTVFLLGGVNALRTSVEQSVAAAGYDVVRLSGDTRYDTAVAVAGEFGSPTSIGVASGESFPDALALSSPAARGGFPLLLVQRNAVADGVRGYIRSLGNPTVHVAGGTAAVSQDVAVDLDELADDGPLVRYGGEDRFGTARAVAEGLFGTQPCTVALASGRNFPDALAGGAHAAASDAPLLLLDQDALPSDTQSYLESSAGPTSGAFLYGGTDAVSEVAATRANGTFEPDTFIFWGDSGESNAHWNSIASQVVADVQSEDVDGIFMLGDNIYETGASSASDPAFATLYEGPLGPVLDRIQAYTVLGNHDVVTANGQYEIDYATTHPYWVMPSHYYNRTVERTCFTALDTNQAAVDSTQLGFLENACAGTAALHTIAIGHHPVFSSGEHGVDNAQPWMDAFVRPVLERAGYDFYLSGHDHNFEAIVPTAGAPRYIVSGGASRLRPITATSQSLFATSQYHYSKLELYTGYANLTAYDELGAAIWTYRYDL